MRRNAEGRIPVAAWKARAKCDGSGPCSAPANELDNGIVRLSTWRGGGRTGVNIWFATWRPERASLVSALGQSAQRFLDRQLGRD